MQARTEAGPALLNDAIEGLAALAGDPVAAAEAAVAADGTLVLGQVYLAYLALYETTAQGAASAAEILKKLAEAGGPPAPREAHHLHAARAWAEGRWEAAARALEQALLLHPRDLLALKVAQDPYFFLGNRLDLRDVAARVLPEWPHGQPGWGYVQGIYAFGLEENADYRQAEARARAALRRNPRDVWAVHALAHVFEMEGSHPERAVDLLIDIRPRAHAVGGSHAQRDVIDLTLLAAAARAGQASLARALVAERTARKPAADAAARQLLNSNDGLGGSAAQAGERGHRRAHSPASSW